MLVIDSLPIHCNSYEPGSNPLILIHIFATHTHSSSPSSTHLLCHIHITPIPTRRSTITSTTPKVVKDVIFINQASWEPWFNSIRASVKDHLWRFFDPERLDAFPEPLTPILLFPEQPPVAGIPSATAGPSTRSTPAPGTVVETPAQQAARKLQNEKQLETYYKVVSAYSQLKWDWEKIADAQAKLRDQIQASVAQHKGSQLDADLSVRQWLQALKASTAPPVETIKQSIRVDYQRFILVGYSDWPTGGPSNWVAK